ncbi:SPOR domain-containing protein [Frateuria defendens]|uniref:SPOR domain-containing protein n=1 Tax=Frateuria defendens TaxID=2219559 RepID=UPI00066FD10D|nr:SPOR domain-containing protein [Frateuria defendens]
MAPRKGKGRQAVRNHSGGFPAWGWAVVGILVGVVLMAVLMRKSLLPMAPSGPQANPQATAQRGSDAGIEPAASAPKKPQYDFYSVLSEKEVRIPDAEIRAQARAEQQSAAAQQAPARPAPAPAPPPANAPAAVSENITAAPATPTSPPASGGGYLLQVGAFPNAGDADSLKARLALQGFVANVQAVNVAGQTFHRVRLGPFRSATDLEAARQRLAGAGIRAIALKEGR